MRCPWHRACAAQKTRQSAERASAPCPPHRARGSLRRAPPTWACGRNCTRGRPAPRPRSQQAPGRNSATPGAPRPGVSCMPAPSVSGLEGDEKQTALEARAPARAGPRQRTRVPLSRTSMPSGPSRRSSAARKAESLRCGVGAKEGSRQSAWAPPPALLHLHAPVLLSRKGDDHRGAARAGGAGRAEGSHHVRVACSQAVYLVRRQAKRQTVSQTLYRARQKGAT